MNSKHLREGQADPTTSQGIHDPALIQHALDEVLASPPFRATRQCQDLLRYVVDNTLAGLDHLLRERVIGAEVFDRKPDYDTSEDPVVRLRAAEVRKRLAQYYQGVSSQPQVRIEIPSGSYRATFDWSHEPPHTSPNAPLHAPMTSLQAAAEAAPLALDPTSGLSPRILDQSPGPRPLHQLSWRWVVLAALVFLGATAIFVKNSLAGPDAAFHQFWAPIVNGQKPVIICMGSNAVYRLSNQFVEQYLAERHEEAHDGFDFFPDIPTDKVIQARDLERAYNSFVALGDVAAVSDVVADLTREGKPFRERFPPDISFAELQSTPTITVGGFNNPLTLTLTKDLRYVLVEGSRIEDHQDRSRKWSINFNGDSRDTEDYAVISRLVDAKTGGPVLSIAGIGQYGTQAAAEFISNPESIAGLVRTAPRDWRKRNIQIVLHIHIVNYRPITTTVIATNYW